MHKIYWFSGTGNTLYAAREFAKSFPDAELHSIASLDRSEDIVFDADVTGIFFPVYCMGIPHIMEQFLARVLPRKDEPAANISMPSALRRISGRCASGGRRYAGEKNINLNACFHIRMPSNYIPLSALRMRTPDDSVRSGKASHPIALSP